MRLSAFLYTSISIARLSNAWPWPPAATGEVSAKLSELLRRQEDDGGDSETDAVSSDSPTIVITSGPDSSETETPSAGDDEEEPTRTTQRSSGSSRSTITSIPQNAQPGGVNMLTPDAQFGGSQYYIVGTTVTWVWNYTSLLRAPGYIDVVATVSSTPGVPVPSPFTLAANLSFEPTVTFTWDTGKYASESPLPVGMYELNVYDASKEEGPFAVPLAGELQPYDRLPFGVYTPGTYYALEPTFQCATCNGAGGKMEGLTWNLLFGVTTATIGTLIWFTGVDGIW